MHFKLKGYPNNEKIQGNVFIPHMIFPVPPPNMTLKEIESLKKEVNQLKGQNTALTGENNILKETLQFIEDNNDRSCRICFECPINTVFLPCGHSISCEKCAFKNSLKNCPICRKVLQQKIKMYMG